MQKMTERKGGKDAGRACPGEKSVNEQQLTTKITGGNAILSLDHDVNACI